MPEETQAPELAKITLPGGIEVQIPKDAATKYHEAQQKHNAEREELAKRVGAIEAERKAAEDRAAAEARDKEAIRLAKDGEIAKARELLTKDSDAKLAKVAARLIAQEIGLAARKHAPGLDDQAVADMVALVSGRAAFDAESGLVTFRDESGNPILADGKPAGADAFLAGFLAQRKHFQPAKVPAAMNGQPANSSAAAQTVRRADYEANPGAYIEGMRKGLVKLAD